MISLLKSLLPGRIRKALSPMRHRWFPSYARESFSLEGEDLILDRFFDGREAGFYVDIGAHHPKRFSNTYLLYRRGWTGINVDANPGSMAAFRRERPRDINLEVGVSAEKGELTFYVFNIPALNTFDRDLALQRVNGKYFIVKEERVQTRPLADLLDHYLPPNTAINLLTVDVEGYDYEVLRSNDWKKYRPEFVLVECLASVSLEQAFLDPIAKLLIELGYDLVAKTMNSVLFLERHE